MNLYGEILARALEGRAVQVTIDGADAQALVKDACYRALEEIRAILENDALEDPEILRRAKAEFVRRTGGKAYDSPIPAEVKPRIP